MRRDRRSGKGLRATSEGSGWGDMCTEAGPGVR